MVSIILDNREADDLASRHLAEFAGVVVYYYVVSLNGGWLKWLSYEN